MIETRHDLSCDEEEKKIVEQKIRGSMVQAHNENIINERNLQVRKRKREGEEIK